MPGLGRPIVNAGSLNFDMVIKTARLPDPGETALGGLHVNHVTIDDESRRTGRG